MLTCDVTPQEIPAAAPICDAPGEEHPVQRRRCCFTGGMLEPPEPRMFSDGGCLFLATAEVCVSAHLAPPASRLTSQQQRAQLGEAPGAALPSARAGLWQLVQQPQTSAGSW